MVDVELAFSIILLLVPFSYFLAYLLDNLMDVIKNPQERDNLDQ
jgi:hypothetical protein